MMKLRRKARRALMSSKAEDTYYLNDWKASEV